MRRLLLPSQLSRALPWVNPLREALQALPSNSLVHSIDHAGRQILMSCPISETITAPMLAQMDHSPMAEDILDALWCLETTEAGMILLEEHVAPAGTNDKNTDPGKHYTRVGCVLSRPVDFFAGSDIVEIELR